MAEKQWCPGCSREVEGVCHHFNCAIGPNGLDAQSRSSAGTNGLPFQKRVVEWLMACFSMEVCRDGVERNHRFLEEALELVQSLGCTRSEAHQLVDYVFNRPVGEPFQELGGSLVTLTALANCHDMDMMEAGETELARVWTKIDKIRAKQAAKPKHSPLPEHVPGAAQAPTVCTCAALPEPPNDDCPIHGTCETCGAEVGAKCLFPASSGLDPCNRAARPPAAPVDQERLAELQNEAGMYKSLYENAIAQRSSAGSERPIAWRRVRDDGVATYWQTEVPDSTPVSISELAKLEADYNEWREAYDRLSAKLPSRAPASNGERGRYSFDDLSIGWTKDGNKIDRKIVPRPPKLSNDGWYQFAGEIIAMLNEPQEALKPSNQLRIALEDTANWLEGCLQCKSWDWDGLQRDAAEQALKDAREALAVTRPQLDAGAGPHPSHESRTPGE
jgi:hypothetical protein